jgi:sugar phosphate isomerase/epimerase
VGTTPLSVQLWSVREALAADLPATIARIAEIGYTSVEPFNHDEFPGLKEAIADAGLTTPTGHSLIVGQDQKALFASARDFGIATLVDPYVDPARWTTREDVAQIAAELTAAAELAADFGVRVAYHNHAFELSTRIDGRPALEVLVDHLGDDVLLEVDTYWVAVGGCDPVDLLTRFGDRVTALHIKDGPGTEDELDQLAVGDGTMPIAEIIAAAPNALRVVEVDDSRLDLFDVITRSFENLAAGVTA